MSEPDKITDYSYDRKSQLTGAETSRQRGRFRTERLYDVSYTYDAAGNRVAMELDGEQLPVQSYAPTHDRQPQMRRPTRVEYSYNDANQLIVETAYRIERRKKEKPAWETTYAYDANGNIMTKTLNRRPGWDDDLAPGQHETRYEYDYQNLLSKISYPDGEINTFQNCRCGTFRLQKVDSQGLRNYLYDKENDSPIFECDGNYHPLIRYTKGVKIDELISRKTYTDNGTPRTVYYLYDGLGSVMALTDEQGNVVASYKYAPFGEILSAEGPEAAHNPFTYTGREYDRDSGLYYFRARYMDPRVGRFTSVDPLIRQAGGNGQSMQYFPSVDCITCGGGIRAVLPVPAVSYTPMYGHSYVYVRNNPINYIYPRGEIIGLLGLPDWIEPWHFTCLGMIPAGFAGRAEFGIQNIRYRCCVNGKSVKLEDYDKASGWGGTWQIAHRMTGCYAKHMGVDRRCLAGANFLWELYEILRGDPKKEPLYDYITDTLADVLAVYEGYDKDGNCESGFIPSECTRRWL
ncbi:MAG: hypothetical protein L6455_10555 [Kiritimatiellae bacterium]|nr:hypothetical protein [Kiritimatiellia bacterium]